MVTKTGLVSILQTYNPEVMNLSLSPAWIMDMSPAWVMLMGLSPAKVMFLMTSEIFDFQSKLLKFPFLWSLLGK